MRFVLPILALLLACPAAASDDLALPKVAYAATAIAEAGRYRHVERIYYADGKMRIERGKGFSTTILDFNTQTQIILMVDHTYIVMPMDDELFRRFVARTPAMSGAQRIGTEQIEGIATTKYAFGDDGASDAAGSYWVTDQGILMKRDYEAGVFGQNVHHTEWLTNLKIAPQPDDLFGVPAGYKRVK
jgi:hypothetical protein